MNNVLTRLVKPLTDKMGITGTGGKGKDDAVDLTKPPTTDGVVRTQDEIDAKFPSRQFPTDLTVSSAETEMWISSTFDKIKTSCMTFHSTVWQCILFYVGQTWIEWDKDKNWWAPSVSEDDFTPQPRINYFAPAIDAICSNFNTVPPIEAVARDADGDEEYKRHGIALIANRVAKDFILRTALKSEFQSKDDKPSEAAMMYVLGGSLFTYLTARDKTPIQSEYLGPIAEKTIECDLLSSLHVVPRPGSFQLGGLGGTPYVYLARRMTLQEAYTRFQINCKPDSAYITGDNTMFQSTLDFFYTGPNNSTLKAEDSALVLEVLCPPSSDNHPGERKFAQKGMYSVYSGSTLHYTEDWGFPEYPLTKIDYIRVPQVFFGRTPAFDLCPLQSEIQDYESLIKLHGMTNATNPWVIDMNSMVNEITGRADKVIKFRSLGPNSHAPKREPSGSLDNGIYAKVQDLKSQFGNISGAAAVFRGRQEGSVTSGTAIAQLRGQAEQMFSRPVLNWNNGWKETVRKAVLFAQKCYTLPQLMKICGNSYSDSITDFMQADLDTCLEWIASDHGLPRTQDELRQEMVELFDKKMLDIKDPAVREKAFALFGETGMLKMFNLDATRARMENKFMKLGRPPVFRPAIEDLEVHYAIHTESVKSLEFDKLTPQIQEIFLAHVMETKAALAPPPPPPAPPPNITFTADLTKTPAPLTDALLASHGIHVAPGVAPPPHHSVGKPGSAQPVVGPHPGTHPTTPAPVHGAANLPSQGKPTSGTLIPEGQGVQPIGAAQGAPPAPPK